MTNFYVADSNVATIVVDGNYGLPMLGLIKNCILYKPFLEPEAKDWICKMQLLHF